MNPIRSIAVATVVIVVFAVGVWRAGPARTGDEHVGPIAPPPTEVVNAPAHSPHAVPDPRFVLQAPNRDPLVGLVGEGLNAAGGSVEDDLRIVDELLMAWRTNFPGQGNPVGLNAEITAALVGRNRLQLELLPADHPAINEHGELCDRWGSPLIFHQIEGDHLELRSAGPDRVAYSGDDLIWNPAEVP